MFRSTKGLAVTGVLLLSFVIAPYFGAGGGKAVAEDAGFYGIGSPASKAQVAGWDIDVRPDGLGLPKGQGTVLQGEELFVEKCAMCHGEFGEGVGRWPVLAGGEDTLSDDRPEKTVGSYWPYATTLWDYIHRAMPFFAPQSLTNDEVYALTAYVLYLNDLVDEEFTASKQNLISIEMPNKSGFYPDDRPDMPRLVCLQDCREADSIRITWDASALGVTPTAHFREDQENSASAESKNNGAIAQVTEIAGKDIYDKACAVCHANGVAGAPTTGDKNAWLVRIEQGVDILTQHAVNGFRGKTGFMPAKGGNSQLSDDDVAAAVNFIVEQSKTGDEPL